MKYQLNELTIYIARVKPNGCIANAKPCQYCLQFIIKHNVAKVCYTLSNDEYIFIEFGAIGE